MTRTSPDPHPDPTAIPTRVQPSDPTTPSTRTRHQPASRPHELAFSNAEPSVSGRVGHGDASTDSRLVRPTARLRVSRPAPLRQRRRGLHLRAGRRSPRLLRPLLGPFTRRGPHACPEPTQTMPLPKFDDPRARPSNGARPCGPGTSGGGPEPQRSPSKRPLGPAVSDESAAVRHTVTDAVSPRPHHPPMTDRRSSTAEGTDRTDRRRHHGDTPAAGNRPAGADAAPAAPAAPVVMPAVSERSHRRGPRCWRNVGTAARRLDRALPLRGGR